jgi:glyceraldehyde-3-phosphate dehydrogenase (NAD(P))
MTRKNIVHVIGTGTIGEPLIGLFTDFKERWGIDEVTFHKRTPAVNDRAMVDFLVNRGAKLVTDEQARDEFARLGHRVSYTAEEALEQATVVVDCTPAGNDNKQKYYQRIKGPKGYIAQGSEFGFGRPYARGINDEVQDADDRFVQVVSCNTHNISVLLKTLASVGGKISLEAGRFVCMRRANDVSDTKSFIAAPEAGKHDDPEFGTHHARDAYHLFQTVGEKLNLFSSAIKINTQYMHTLWFDLDLRHETTRSPRCATTRVWPAR